MFFFVSRLNFRDLKTTRDQFYTRDTIYYNSHWNLKGKENMILRRLMKFRKAPPHKI